MVQKTVVSNNQNAQAGTDGMDMTPAEANALAHKLRAQYVVAGFYDPGDAGALDEAAKAYGFAPKALQNILKAALMDLLDRLTMATVGFNTMTGKDINVDTLIQSAIEAGQAETKQHNDWSASANQFRARISAAAKALQVEAQVSKAYTAKLNLKKQPQGRPVSPMAFLVMAISRPVSSTKTADAQEKMESVWVKSAIIDEADPRLKELVTIEVRTKKITADAAFLPKAMANLEAIGYPLDKIIALLADLMVACQEQTDFDTEAIAQVTADTEAFTKQVSALVQEEGELKQTATFFGVKM